jgi:beta-1,3-galactosyl-O-glycosyl-glycoprotein beta-1,6-N-acetylglucosaminyltransferase/N-acetyllactosaminide beta-1,6-N-acetylglucosaminyltransferase
MDSKSPKEFHDQVRALAKCFPNVFVMEKEFDMDSGGKSMNYAHVECMKALAKPELKWKYMVLLEV